MAFEHMHKTHSAVLVYRSGVLSAEAAHDVAEFMLRIASLVSCPRRFGRKRNVLEVGDECRLVHIFSRGLRNADMLELPAGRSLRVGGQKRPQSKTVRAQGHRPAVQILPHASQGLTGLGNKIGCWKRGVKYTLVVLTLCIFTWSGAPLLVFNAQDRGWQYPPLF